MLAVGRPWAIGKRRSTWKQDFLANYKWKNNIVSYKVVQDFLFCVIPLFEENFSLLKSCLGKAEFFKSMGNNEAQKNLVMCSPLVAVEFLKSRGKS